MYFDQVLLLVAELSAGLAVGNRILPSSVVWAAGGWVPGWRSGLIVQSFPKKIQRFRNLLQG
jgi:hypothetical protein